MPPLNLFTLYRASCASFAAALASFGLLSTGLCEDEADAYWIDLTSSKQWKACGLQKDDLSNWEFRENGEIHCLGKKGFSDLVTVQTFEHFEFEFEWKTGKPRVNSGVFYRIPSETDWISKVSPEFQLYGMVKKQPTGTTVGGLYSVMQPDGVELSPAGEWNSSRLIVHGSRVEHVINGKTVLTYAIESPEWRKAVAASKKEDPAYGLTRNGHLALQDHEGPIIFRHLRIRRLAPPLDDPHLDYGTHPISGARLLPPVNGAVLGPEEAINYMKLAPGWRVELVAAEPLIENPLTLDFDNEGRLWVVELNDYMIDLDATGEFTEIGRIKVLTDTDGDGRMDEASIFLDGLVQARAFSFYGDGILFADHETLYYVPILEDGSAGKREVVDKRYATTGNVEHRSNGLYRALDNWIYNAKSGHRYRRTVAGKWLKEKTTQRGQWNLSQDDDGHLFYGKMNAYAISDRFPSGTFSRNQAIKMARAQDLTPSSLGIFGARLSDDIRARSELANESHFGEHRFFPSRPTASTSPIVYRGAQFGPKYDGVVFTLDPAYHLVKATRPQRDTRGQVTFENVYEDQEVLASSDTRFRPVFSAPGLDDSLYIADLYHGIVQYKAFMNDPLAEFIVENGLENPVGLGRVYRLSRSDRAAVKPLAWSELNTEQLVATLGDASGFNRDRAQQTLVDLGTEASIAAIREYLLDSSTPELGIIHAMWTLEGLEKLTFEDLQQVTEGNQNPRIFRHAVLASWALPDTDELLSWIEQGWKDRGQTQMSYLVVQRVIRLAEQSPAARNFLAQLDLDYVDAEDFRLAMQSGLSVSENPGWLRELGEASIPAALSQSIVARRKKAQEDKKRFAQAAGEMSERFAVGKTIYQQLCVGCHGSKGEGIPMVGPSLSQSEWIADREVAIQVVLHGLAGPITVNGEAFDASVVMPGVKDAFSDEQIAAVLTYVGKSFGNDIGEDVDPSEVAEIRVATADRQQMYTVDDLEFADQDQ